MEILMFNVFNFLNKLKKTTVPLIPLCPTFPYFITVDYKGGDRPNRSPGFAPLRWKHFSNALGASSFYVLSCMRQSVAQELDKIHFLYARMFYRPTSWIGFWEPNRYLAWTERVLV